MFSHQLPDTLSKMVIKQKQYFVLNKRKQFARKQEYFEIWQKYYITVGRNKHGKKRTLFNKVDQVAFSVKISNLLICFHSFNLSCPILEKDSFVKILCVELCCLIK